MGNNRDRPTGPLTDEEILESLKHSGFPLEIRLLQAFDDGGFDPSPPHRFVLGGGDKEQSAEIDVTARAMETLAEHRGLLLLTLMVEAKQVDERVTFVGFKWKQPTPLEMRAARMRFCGLPTCKVLNTGVDGGRFDQFLLGGEAPAMAALDCLNEAPLCHHWCFVRDSRKHGFIEATQEDDMRQSFRRLVHATTWLERGSALYALRHPADAPLLRLEIKFPTIVIATPELRTFDPLTNTLEKTQSLTLREMYEVGGEVHARYVDVVTEGEIPNLMARYRKAARALRAACDQGAGELSKIVAEQRTRQQTLDLQDST
ncbi:MAG: hypothetical protein JO257_07470 [Deltaproteobacteria bacterium]|nr:hypothetical protein [Deltaproteobacteria bacterium]